MSQSETISLQGGVCPLPLRHMETIVLGHGSGGQLTQELIQKVFMPHFQNKALNQANDAALLQLPVLANLKGSLSISTDSHIVSPLFFPGGDIGRLSICGTVNDVAMLGAEPLYITVGFILEEGLSVQTLNKVVESMQSAALEAGIMIVAGDTKVVEKGKADGIFITTAGIGWVPEGRRIGGQYAAPGDDILISGTMGDHGIAVLAARGELGLETDIKSDVAPLNKLIADVIEAAPHVHVLRDPTRGGLATTLNEIAMQSKVGLWVEEKTVPVQPAVRAACEMLGFDPLYLANEGKVIVIVPANETQAALDAMRRHPYGKNATRIGAVTPTPPGRVLMRTLIGGSRILDVLAGEMLPRIC